MDKPIATHDLPRLAEEPLDMFETIIETRSIVRKAKEHGKVHEMDGVGTRAEDVDKGR